MDFTSAQSDSKEVDYALLADTDTERTTDLRSISSRRVDPAAARDDADEDQPARRASTFGRNVTFAGEPDSPSVYSAHGAGSDSPASVHRGRKGKRRQQSLRAISVKDDSLYNSLLQRSSSARSMNRLSLAAKYVLDARAGVPVDLEVRNFQNPVFQWMAKARRTELYRWFIRAVITLQCSLLFWETRPVRNEFNGETLGVELALFVIYFVDIALAVLDEGWRRYLSNFWHTLYASIVLILFFELIIAISLPVTVAGFNYMRALRPLLFLCKFKTLRMLFRTMLVLIPHIIHVLLLGFVLVSVFAVVGIAVFHGRYDWGGFYEMENFDNYPAAAIGMLILLTTENFPDIVLPGLQALPGTAAVFFVLFIMLGSWVYMSLLLAVIFDQYKQLHEKQVMDVRVKAQQSLLMAFSILNDDGEHVDYRAFRGMMRHVRPNACEDEVRVLFKCLDEDCNGNVDPEEFLRLADILRYELTPMPRPLPYEPGRARNVWGRLYDAFTYPSPTMLPLIYSRWFKRVVKGVLVCNTIAIIAWYPGSGQSYALTLDVINYVCVACMSVEVVVKMYTLSLKDFLHDWAGKLDLAIVLISIPVEMFTPSASVVDDTGTQWVQIFRSLRLLRIITLVSGVKRIVRALVRGLSTFVRLLGLLAILFYIYVVIGLELLSGPPKYYEPDYWNPETFNTIWQGLFSLFQIATTNNWNDVLYSLSKDMWQTIFFITFYFLVCVILLNIVTALVIETYSAFSEETGTAKAAPAAASQASMSSMASSPSTPPGAAGSGGGAEAQGLDSVTTRALRTASALSGLDEYSRSGASAQPEQLIPEVDDEPSLEEVAYVSSSPCPSHAGSPAGSPRAAAPARPEHRHECPRSILTDSQHTHTVYRVDKIADWSRMLVRDRLPEIRKGEIASLRSKVLELKTELESMASTAQAGKPSRKPLEVEDSGISWPMSVRAGVSAHMSVAGALGARAVDTAGYAGTFAGAVLAGSAAGAAQQFLSVPHGHGFGPFHRARRHSADDGIPVSASHFTPVSSIKSPAIGPGKAPLFVGSAAPATAMPAQNVASPVGAMQLQRSYSDAAVPPVFSLSIPRDSQPMP